MVRKQADKGNKIGGIELKLITLDFISQFDIENKDLIYS